MRYTLITQIVLVALSLILIVTFLKPAFADMKVKQDDLFLYKDTVAKVEELNRTLQGLVATKNAFSEKDLNTLNSFIPEKIDSLKVMRDIESIFKVMKTPLLTLSPSEIVAPTQNGEVEFESALELPEAIPVAKTVYQDFSITFASTYAETKKVLEMMERNQTLLEVIEFSLNPITKETLDDIAVAQDANEGLFSVAVTVRTFGLSAE